MAVVLTGACTGCGACLLTCPEHAVRPGETDAVVVVDALCTACLECVEVCPADALEEVRA